MTTYTIYRNVYTLKCETDMDWWTLNKTIFDLMKIKDNGPVLTQDHAARIAKTSLEAIARRDVGNTGKTKKKKKAK